MLYSQNLHKENCRWETRDFLGWFLTSIRRFWSLSCNNIFSWWGIILIWEVSSELDLTWLASWPGYCKEEVDNISCTFCITINECWEPCCCNNLLLAPCLKCSKVSIEGSYCPYKGLVVSQTARKFSPFLFDLFLHYISQQHLTRSTVDETTQHRYIFENKDCDIGDERIFLNLI